MSHSRAAFALLAALLCWSSLSQADSGVLQDPTWIEPSVSPTSPDGRFRRAATQHESPWPYRTKVTVNPDSIEGEGPLLGFPLLLSLNADNAASVFEHSKDDGSDIAVLKPDGVTPLRREIVRYDIARRAAEIWVRADTLSKTKNVFYLYYGKPDTTIAPADGSVWDSSYVGVYHFAEDPGLGTLRDYSGRASHAIARNGWTSADTTHGAIGQAWLLNGSSHWIDGSAISTSDSSFTFSAWFGVHDQFRVHAAFTFQSEEGFWHLSAMRNNTLRYPDLSADGTMAWLPALPDTLPHHFVWCLDGVSDTARFFFDGTERTVALRYAPNPPYKVYTGETIGGHVGIVGPSFGDSDPEDLFDGLADEYRIYEGIRSSDWILTEYRSQRLGGDFVTYDPEEVTPILLWGLVALPGERAIYIRWQALESAFDRFYVDRSVAAPLDGRFLRLNADNPVGSRGPWEFEDSMIESAMRCTYRVVAITPTGDSLFFGPVTVTAPSIGDPSLILSGPNPTTARGRFVLCLPRSGHASILVSDCAGRRVRNLLDKNLEAGSHHIEWDGKDSAGRTVTSGTYFVQLRWNHRTVGRRLVLLR